MTQSVFSKEKVVHAGSWGIHPSFSLIEKCGSEARANALIFPVQQATKRVAFIPTNLKDLS